MKKTILVSLIAILFTAACTPTSSSSKKGLTPDKPVPSPDEPVAPSPNETGVTQTDWSRYLYKAIGKCENGNADGSKFRYLSSEAIPFDENPPGKELFTFAQLFLMKDHTYKMLLTTNELLSRESNGDITYGVEGTEEIEGRWQVVGNDILLYKDDMALVTGSKVQFSAQDIFQFKFMTEKGSWGPVIRFGYVESNAGYNEICPE